MDTVIGRAKGKNQTCLVLTERLTRYELILKLKDKTTVSVTRALNHLKRQGKAKLIKSFTVDNCPEFQDYASMKEIRYRGEPCIVLEHRKGGGTMLALVR